MAEERENKVTQDDEIDLIELAKTIWTSRRFIAKVTVVFAIIGLIIAFTSPIEYEASCKLLAESQEGASPKLGGLGGLAGLAGFDLKMGETSVLSPALYPQIVSSYPFLQKILNDSIYFQKLNRKITTRYYFENVQKPSLLGYITKYTIGLPGILKKAVSAPDTLVDNPNAEYLQLTKVQWDLIQTFSDRIQIEIDEEVEVITVSVEMPDRFAAAAVADKIVNQLTDKVTSYKLQKAVNSLEFVQISFADAKSKFELTQNTLASFKDRHRNISSASAQIELQRIQNEYDVAFEVYKNLAKQLEQSKIKLKEETPVFTILEPVRIPEINSEPNRKFIFVAFVLLGLITSTAVVLTKNLLL